MQKTTQNYLEWLLLFLKMRSPKPMLVTKGARFNRLLVSEREGERGMLVCGKVTDVSALVGFEIYPLDKMLPCHRVTRLTDVYRNTSAVIGYLWHVLFLRSVRGAGKQLLHILSAAGDTLALLAYRVE